MRQIKITKSLTGRDTHSLDLYFQEVSKVSAVTPQEEADLAKRIKKGDQAALEKLVNANLRFVISVAKQYQHNGLSLSDLISEGALALETVATAEKHKISPVDLARGWRTPLSVKNAGSDPGIVFADQFARLLVQRDETRRQRRGNVRVGPVLPV